MKKKYIILFILFVLVKLSMAQNLLTVEQKNNLLEIGHRQQELYQENLRKALSKAKKLNLPKAFKVDNKLVLLDGIDENGQLIYVTSDNEGAAITTATDKIKVGGDMGLYLTGENMEVGVWEVGSPILNHQEYIGRVSYGDAQTGIDDHSCHVIGTIAAQGINLDAEGMATQVNIKAYTANNDESEMANAASNGLILSNHSYGIITGWHFDGNWYGNPNISALEDYRFGFYTTNTQTWDNVAYNAPYYLICKSSGNNRDDFGDGTRPPDGNQGAGYDCIGPEGVAKNILTVGAVNKLPNYTVSNDVVMSIFSGWGPTDDGRIKPDIVACGVGVFSSVNAPTAYGTLSGTSMSTPNTTGSLVLIQELHKLYYDTYLRASTLKGLVIHTALEAGNAPGPDYSFGWGLLNAERMAYFVTQKEENGYSIVEDSLQDGQVKDYTIFADGTNSLIATLCWTDPAGTPVSPSLDPIDLMLINDLDIEVIAPDGTTIYLPWILNPANPNAPATTGNNFRDNVEKVEIPTPISGIYTIRITHKNALSSTQHFSLIASTSVIDNPRQAFYWIGGSGNWQDASHWSYQSGGTANPDNLLPTINNVVIFDENSFSTDNQIVSLNSDANCFNFNWLINRPIEINSNNFNININSSLLIDEDVPILNNIASFRFLGTDSRINHIRVNNNSSLNASFIFDAIDDIPSWTTLSDLSIARIEVNGGTFDISDMNITVDEITSNGINQGIFNIENTFIENLKNIDIQNPNIDIQITGSELVFDNIETNKLLYSDNTIWNRIISTDNTLSISGTSNTFNYLGYEQKLDISGNHSFGILEAYDNASLETLELTLASNSTQTILEDLILPMIINRPLELKTDGIDKATIFSSNPRRFCFDYLNIDNVDVTGTTQFVSGINSTLTNADGWTEANCSDLLFADFEYFYFCEGGITEFNNLSTGNITDWSWNFDLGNPSPPTSTDPNPSFSYENAGVYMIELQVSDGTNTETYIRNIEIIENTDLSKPNVILQGGNVLLSSVSAGNYQWYRDGVAIENAVESFYLIDAAGNYSVEVWNQDCKFRSDELLVTSLQTLDEHSLKVYPNPTSDRLLIKNLKSGIKKVILKDVRGKVILEKKTIEEIVEIDLSRFTQGVYILEIDGDGFKQQEKIIKY